jgi:hypothetical protein
MDQNQAIEQVKKIKARYEKKLMKLANVVGVGVGFKHKDGQPTNEVALVVNVSEKKPSADLSKQDLVPSELEGVPVDVQEVGKIKAL